jgi:hypothetical protein
MPEVDRAALRDIGNVYLPQIRDALNPTTNLVANTSNDQSVFAETQPDGWGVIYAETAKSWGSARQALHKILVESVTNTDQSAQAVLRMAHNYTLAEEHASGLLNDIARRLEGL